MQTKQKPGSLTTRYKKQHGMHHKYSNKYLKVYWPYIPLFLFVLTGIITSIVVLGSKSISSSSQPNISLGSLLSSANVARENKNLTPLSINSALSTAAQIKANDMATQNYYSPISPSGETPWQIVTQVGYQYQVAGENLAYGFNTASAVVSAWTNSSNNTNILNTTFNDVGFGIAESPNFQNQGQQTIIVAIYADPAGSTTTTKINQTSQSFTSASISQPKSITISKVESLTNQYSRSSVFIIGAVVGIGVCFLFIRHTIVLKKWLVEGETLVIKHPFIDFLVVVIIVGLASLNQTIGIIR